MKIRSFRLLPAAAAALMLFAASCSKKSSASGPSGDDDGPAPGDYHAPRAATAPAVDGSASDSCWAGAEWAGLDFLWLGSPATAADFRGRYKIVWVPDKLYYLVEITDDVLADTHNDPLSDYWNDDCLELFIDEDNSGGNHQNSHNAFAYHIALNYRAVDLSPAGPAREYTTHLQARRASAGTVHTWEVALDAYTSAYVDGAASNPKATLAAGKVIGFAIAYCDADRSGSRENFYGSVDIPGADKNTAWMDADVFGTLTLKE